MLLSLQGLSPDGHWLALRDENDYFWLWQYAGNQLADMPVLTFNSPSIPAFSSEGRTLVVASYMSGLVLRYHPADLLSTACELTGRNLSLAEWQQAFGDEPYHRTCPQLPPSPTTAQPIVLDAENLARSGNLEQASERFRAAQAINPYLALDPDREPRRLYALVLAEEGRQLARADRVDEAVVQLRQALALAPELDLDPNTPEPENDPEALANQILLDILAERAATALGEERAGDAITALNRILALDASRLDAWLLSDACFLGGLEEPLVAQAALPLCDRLVATADPTVDFRGTRALARMRAGDLAGALEDLRAYRAWMQTNQEALGENFQRAHDQAQSWITALEAGRNPIDDAAIVRLREEYRQNGFSP
jgi:tetratricopeptide (TPR) repeat protein